MIIKQTSPVNSHNEWDPLEEVIIGSLDGAMFPAWNVINEATVPPNEWTQIEKKWVVLVFLIHLNWWKLLVKI